MPEPYIQRYRRPPITEAVIEFRLRDQLEHALLQKVAARSKRRFAFDEEEYAQTIQFGTQNPPIVGQSVLGRRLSSDDRADVLLLRPTTLAVSRLAPYRGWEYLQERAQELWDDLRHFAVKPIVNRLGVRFINRIDAPTAEGKIPQLVNIFPSYPPVSEFPPKQSFVQVTLKLDNELQVVINSLPTESPVPAHVGWILDIDVSAEGNVPLRDDEIWALLGRMRTAKNRVFESLITQDARRLFEG
jgi:uncharacterized protein (TIGR04255 family)